MRIAVSAETDGGLDAPVSAHFGRCPYYALVDAEGDAIRSVQMVANPHYPQHVPGAIPAFIHSQDVSVMLTGGMGYRAASLFEEYGIEAVTGGTGTVREAVLYYLSGELTGYVPCREGHEHACGDGHDHGQRQG